MNAIRIHTTFDSSILQLPELKPFLGKAVEIVVREDSSAMTSVAATPPAWISPLAGSILRDSDPFGPAVPADEWEANR